MLCRRVKLKFHKYKGAMQHVRPEGLAAMHKMLQHATRFDRVSDRAVGSEADRRLVGVCCPIGRRAVRPCEAV